MKNILLKMIYSILFQEFSPEQIHPENYDTIDIFK